jgi:hypothetical protein
MAMKENWTLITLVVAGSLMLGAGLLFSDILPLPIVRREVLAFVLLGLGFAVAFSEGLVTGWLTVPADQDGGSGRTTTYTGLAARLYSLFFAFTGLAVAAGSLLEWLWPGVISAALETGRGVGLLGLLVGTAVCLHSAVQLLGAHRPERGWSARLSRLMEIGLGLLGLAFGLALLAGGAAFFVAPGLWDALLQVVREWFRNLAPPVALLFAVSQMP